MGTQQLCVTRAGRARSKTLRAAIRATCMVVWTIGIGVAHALVAAVVGMLIPNARRRVGAWSTQVYLRGMAWLAGWRVRVEGPTPPPGSLLTPNHLGYADVIALGSRFSLLFVAKDDVARWPVIGRLFRAAHHVAVPRHDPRALPNTVAAIRRRLEQDMSVCVFLEGTSTGGDRVLPFAPSLVQAAVEADAPLVPVAIRWHCDDPAVIIAEDVAYWREEHAFGPHLWRLLGLSGIQARITFGEPLPRGPGGRQQLAQAAHDQVCALLAHTAQRAR